MKFKHGIKLLSAALLAISYGGCGTGIPAAETEETTLQQISEAKSSMDENITGAQTLVDYYPLFNT